MSESLHGPSCPPREDAPPLTAAAVAELCHPLAVLVRSSNDPDVVDAGAVIARLYKQESSVAWGLLMVRSMVHRSAAPTWDHPLMIQAGLAMRQRLTALVAWARSTGRMPPEGGA